jgi:hypothetical protein
MVRVEGERIPENIDHPMRGRLEGRELTAQEINLSLAQGRRIGRSLAG